MAEQIVHLWRDLRTTGLLAVLLGFSRPPTAQYCMPGAFCGTSPSFLVILKTQGAALKSDKNHDGTILVSVLRKDLRGGKMAAESATHSACFTSLDIGGDHR